MKLNLKYLPDLIMIILAVIVFIVVNMFLSGCITQSQKETVEGLWDKIPTQATPEPGIDWEAKYGRKLEWFTPQGKRVEVYENGLFVPPHWINEAKKSWDGIVCKYLEKFPNSDIVNVEIDGTETRINSYITAFDPNGRYIDDGTPAKVPDGIQEWIRTKYKNSGKPSPFYLEFEYSNQADAIRSLGGLFVISGPEGHLNMPAQKRAASDCGGERTYLR